MKKPPVEKLPVINIWTDGSGYTGDRQGGWAAVLKHGQKVKVIWGHLDDTTSQRAELTAALKGLAELRCPCIVALCSDSQYLVNGMTTWRHSWACKSWLKSDGKPVLNKDLWEELIEAEVRHEVSWSWTRGHADDKWNICADTYAGKGRLSTSSYNKCRLTPEDVLGMMKS